MASSHAENEGLLGEFAKLGLLDTDTEVQCAILQDLEQGNGVFVDGFEKSCSRSSSNAKAVDTQDAGASALKGMGVYLSKIARLTSH